MSQQNLPDWSNYFLGQAFLASQRSPDQQTKCGCVITNAKNQVIGQGYNGFPRGAYDKCLPKVRPAKYPWMIHAEVNAILNCSSTLDSSTAYITTKPCFNCTLLMWQAGVTNIVYAMNGSTPHMIDNDEEYGALMSRMLSMTDITIRGVVADLSFISNFMEQR